jgi:hypothetical protein
MFGYALQQIVRPFYVRAFTLLVACCTLANNAKRARLTLGRTGIDLLRPVDQLFRVRRHQRVTLSRQLHNDPPLS